MSVLLGKHINKNTMAQWMTDKKIVWKGISVDCTAFAAACPHCTLGERKSEPISKQSFKDVIKKNIFLLLIYEYLTGTKFILPVFG